MFQLSRTVCSSMTDRNGRFKLFSAIQMMQDCSEYWKESEPVFKRCLEENGAAQLLVSRQLEIIRVPRLYERLTCSTSVYDCQGANGFRNTVITDESGAPCYVSWSQGAFVNTATGRLLRIPREVVAQMQIDSRYEMEYRPRKIELPGVPAITLPSIRVQSNDIDYNQHVNNAQYIRMALEYVPAGFEIDSMRVEYKRPVKYGAHLNPMMLVGEGTLCIVLHEADRASCVIEFTRRKTAPELGWYSW